MRLRVLSDLHLEFGPLDLPDVAADVVILAGDIHTGTRGVRWVVEHFPGTPVLYVPGNHEFYGEMAPRLLDDLRAAAVGSTVHVLDLDSIEIGDVLFLGCTLWTDFALLGDAVSAQLAAFYGMNDYRRIRLLPRYRRLRPSDTLGWHLRARRWLEGQLASHYGRRIVVLTHHALSMNSLSADFRSHPLAPACTSNLDAVVEGSGAELWIHGHTHRACDYHLGTTRVISNPRGYPDEAPISGFDPGLAVEI